MSDNDDGKKKPSELYEAADALRRKGKRGREEDRTTLEMTDPTDGTPPDELGELLVSQGLITRHQLFNALNESYRTGTTLEQAIAAMGLVDRETLASIVLAHKDK
jgi:hypothetical protein